VIALRPLAALKDSRVDAYIQNIARTGSTGW
jgi:hypothetical protein